MGGRPERAEYNEFYHGYVSAVPEGDIIDLLAGQREETRELLRGIPVAKESHRYAPDKWSVCELVGHLIDTERVFAYRALRFARGDDAPLAGMDQELFMRDAGFDRRPLQELADELDLVRRSNLPLFASFSTDARARVGVASGWPVSVRALLYIIAGHERHHIGVLRERYL